MKNLASMWISYNSSDSITSSSKLSKIGGFKNCSAQAASMTSLDPSNPSTFGATANWDTRDPETNSNLGGGGCYHVVFFGGVELSSPETNRYIAPENGWLVQMILSFWGVKRPIFSGILLLVLGRIPKMSGPWKKAAGSSQKKHDNLFFVSILEFLGCTFFNGFFRFL